MKSNCYPLIKSIEYQTKTNYQPQPKYRIRTNNQLKATLLFNLLNNQQNLTTPIINSPVKLQFEKHNDDNYKKEEFCLVSDDKQENHYENNDIISLNVDFSTDGTENKTNSSSSRTSSSSSASDDNNDVNSLVDDPDSFEKNKIIYNDAHTSTGNTNPVNCSLELSALSTFSSASSSSMTLTKENKTISMPSISMELESINKNLRARLKESYKRNKLENYDSDTSVFTSISSTYSNNEIQSNKRISNESCGVQKLVKSLAPFKTSLYIPTTASPITSPKNMNNLSVTYQICRMPSIQSVRKGGNVYAKHKDPNQLTFNAIRDLKEQHFTDKHASQKSDSAPVHTPARPADTLPKVNNQECFKKCQQQRVYSSHSQIVNQRKIAKLKETKAFKASSIETLDNYLLVLIFSKLNTIEKLMLQFVCKRWHHIIWSQEYSYMLYKRIEINNLSIPLHRYIFGLKNNSESNNEPQKKNDESEKNSKKQIKKTNSLVKFIRSKFTKQSKKISQQQQQANEKVNNNSNTTIQQLSDLKENNFFKFHINADLVLDFLLNKLLIRYTYPFSICVESIQIKNNHWLTDRGIDLIGKRCPELTALSIKNCSNIKTLSIMKLITKCPNIKTLDLTGCFKISNLIVSKEKASSIIHDFKDSDFILFEPIGNYFYLQFIDLSYCSNITDNCILNIGKQCIYLRNLYLKKCQLITDSSLLYITKYCFYLRELSIAQCNRITDSGIKYLGDGRLLSERNFTKFQIKYLNMSRCSQITDESLIYLSNQGFFKAIRHLNLRNCNLITDKFMKFLSGSRYIQKLNNHFELTQQNWNPMGLEEFVPFQLKSLDLAFCPLITDKSIEYLCRMISVNDNLEKLYLSNCPEITDYGIRILALNCKLLSSLNVKKCPKITSRSLKDIKINCRSCIIQHTNFSFC